MCRLHGRKITFAVEDIFASERNKPTSGREKAFLKWWHIPPTKNEPLQRNRGHILIFLSIELNPCHWYCSPSFRALLTYVYRTQRHKAISYCEGNGLMSWWIKTTKNFEGERRIGRKCAERSISWVNYLLGQEWAARSSIFLCWVTYGKNNYYTFFCEEQTGAWIASQQLLGD